MKQLEQAVANHARIHFIGIGGVMMSSLALELARRGAHITGSDRDESENTAMLREHGIPVAIGHRPEYVAGAAVIVRNAAIADTSPDIAYARAAGIPILERPQVLGQIMREYPHSIGVSGTHGKSTVSGMLTHVLLQDDQSPTAFLGAPLPEIHGTYTLGHSPWFVAESCEYCRSFHELYPETAVILNVEPDHLDYYSGIEEIIGAFRVFAEHTPEHGLLVVNAANENAMRAVTGLNRRILTFGGDGQYRAEAVRMQQGCAAYTLTENGMPLCEIELAVPGQHNLDNSLAVAAVLRGYGFAPDVIARGLQSYTGVLRRFQRIGTCNGAVVVDDYAHHPDELETTLKTAKTLGFQRVICLFQPHTYSRTVALKDRFCEVLRLADVVVCTDIYSAREQNTFGISSADLTAEIPGAQYIPALDDAAVCLAAMAQPGDLILTCGAGNVNRVAAQLAGSTTKQEK